MSKLLISGSGKGNSAIYFWCFIYLLMAIAGGALMRYASTMQITQRNFFATVTVPHPMADNWFYFGLIMIICGFIGAIIMAYCIRKSQIDVYEDLVEGIGVSKYFLMGDARTMRFKLAYDQIVSTDMTNNSIIIRTSSAGYICYASNASEIQSVIFSQKQLSEKKK